MDHLDLVLLAERHPSWRLLRADNAPLIIGFLRWAFVEPNVRSMPEPDLVGKLDDYLYAIHEVEPSKYPRPPRDYLTDWAQAERGWLRKYYPTNSDTPAYDLTSATEKVIEWVDSLAERQFVGTESRLLTAIGLLRDIAEGTERDSASRIAMLEQRRSEIDAEISRIRSGELDVLDHSAVRDRFQQFVATATGLLRDFREVEENFRRLDRNVREQIATWDGPRGQLLASVFGEQDAIGGSDQGRSFRAFWDLLMSGDQQQELRDLLRRVLDLEALTSQDRGLARLQDQWQEAGDEVQQTVAHLSRQLRRFLDDQAYLDNRRIAELVRHIEASSVQVRDTPPKGDFMSLPGASADLRSQPMMRRLYESSRPAAITQTQVEMADAEVDTTALYDQVVVDPVHLELAIRRSLTGRGQVSLGEVVDDNPLDEGLTEFVEYLRIADRDPAAAINSQERQTIEWSDRDGNTRQADVPLILFTSHQGDS